MKKSYYVAYGSNLHLGQMAYRCPDATVVGTTMLRNWRLMFKGSKSGNYATIEPCLGECVPVTVWEVSRRDVISLDRYEGYPVFYYKEIIPMVINGESVDTFVYIMNDQAHVGYPAQSYIDTLEHGYETFGFDKSILWQALNRCK